MACSVSDWETHNAETRFRNRLGRIDRSAILNEQTPAKASNLIPSSLRIDCDDVSSINLQAAEAAEEGTPALRKFSMVAYTGGAMRLVGWPYLGVNPWLLKTG